MSKINRRDCLKGMAATAGMVAMSASEITGQGDHSARRQTRKRAKPTQPVKRAAGPTGVNRGKWLTTPTKPAMDSFVTVIFAGLMGYFYDSGIDTGQVAFHGHAAHNLTVQIYRYPQCVLHHTQPIVQANTRLITLSVPGSTKHVEYFERNAGQPFRRDQSEDPNDFRWLPDLDGEDFYYPERYPKQIHHFRTWLNVRNATFYTRLRTNSTYKLVDPGEGLIKPFGHVALIMGAALDVFNGGDHVLLEVEGQAPIRLEPQSNQKYQVIFRHLCASACRRPVIHSPDETLRNEFYLARRVLNLPRNAIEIGLMIEQAQPGTNASDICNFSNLVNAGIPAHDIGPSSSDEAPCSGAGYGWYP